MTRTTADRDLQRLPELPLPRERECPFGPPPEYARLQADSPVVRVACPTGITAWLVSRYADVREVLSDPRRFVTRPGLSAHILTHQDPDQPPMEGEFSRMDGPDHLRFRRHLAPEVSSLKRINELRPLVQRIVDERLDALADATPPVDFYGGFASPVTTSVIAELLGVPEGDRALFQQAAEALFDPATTGGDFAAAIQPLLGYLFSLVGTRRAAPDTDILSRMITRSDDGDRPFTDIELVMMSAALLVAGFDTTASMITYGFLALLEHPDQLARLRDDPAVVPAAVEEIVRYLGVGTGLLRQATADTTIGGQPVAAGDYVVVAIQAANRDPSLYPDPDRLDVARHPATHLGFGHGPHQCVGQQLARLELAIVLETVSRRIPSLRLAVALGEIDFKTDSIVRRPVALPVTWDAVLPAPAR